MLNESQSQSGSIPVDEIKFGELRKQLEAGFLISSYFQEIKD